jgi:hypothetical protein
MSKRTDNLENNATYGNISILPNSNTNEGDGSLEVYGTVYTDTIIPNTDNGDINLQGILFNTDKFTILNTPEPTNVVNSSQMFYVESDKFKSIDSTGLVTIYQPTTTKGDLIVNNGTTTTRLPIGTNGQVLTVNPATTTSLEWKIPSNIRIKTFSFGQNELTTTMPFPVGSNMMSIYNMLSTGCSANYLTSKSNANLNGVITILNSNLSLSSNSAFISSYPAYHGLQLTTNKNDITGAYDYIDSSEFINTPITLTNISPVNYSTNTIGVFFISISNYIGGPCATFMICKSYAASNSAIITMINSSPSLSPVTQLNISWPSNDGLSISKTTSSYNGTYYITDNLQYTLHYTITLTGTSVSSIPAIVFPYYQQMSFYVSVVSQVTNGPNAIFYVSKNAYDLNGNIGSTVSLGYPSNERLNLTWNANSLLGLSKNGVNFNGNYILTFTKIN